MAALVGVDCTICHNPLLGEGEILTTECHYFHTACITPWLVAHTTCPNCRGNIAGRVHVYHPPVAPVPLPLPVQVQGQVQGQEREERNAWDVIAAIVSVFVKWIFSLICCEDPEIAADVCLRRFAEIRVRA